MPDSYRIAADTGLRFSPIWDDEAAVYDPASTQVFVVTELAAHLLKTIQDRVTPLSMAELVAVLERDPRLRDRDGLRHEIESMLVELEHLGFVESALP